jgi:hypothetical protein
MDTHLEGFEGELQQAKEGLVVSRRLLGPPVVHHLTRRIVQYSPTTHSAQNPTLSIGPILSTRGEENVQEAQEELLSLFFARLVFGGVAGRMQAHDHVPFLHKLCMGERVV